MERFVVAIATLVCVFLWSNLAGAQQFSSDQRYLEFYRPRFNAEYELQSEPAIALWWIVERFGDKNTTLEELRIVLERHATLFPDCKYAKLVASHLDVVTRMLKEQRPSDDHQNEQLIYDLRELNMHQFHQPNRGLRIIGQGSFRFEGLATNRDAAQQLKDVGYDAIPSLIDQIDDDTLTRSTDFWRDSVFSHRILTVGECCGQIIDAILPTGREFDFSRDPKAAKQAMKNHYRQLIAQKKAEQ